MRYLRTWLDAQPALKSIVASVERSEPEFDADKWYDGLEPHGGIDWPDSETGRAKVIWRILDRLADGELQAHHVAWNFSGEPDANDAMRDFTDHAVEAFIEYLEQRVAVTSDML